MDLTGDGHVHTEWSYDTGGPHSDAAGRMRLMCRRAVLVGLPALAFTEHLDFTGWAITPEDELPDYCRPWVDEDGVLTPPLLDVEGYLESIERCRREFPQLHILSGVEFGQPHLDEGGARQLIDLDALDRVNGSLHTIPTTNDPGSVRSEPYTLYQLWPADDVIRSYLAETIRMITAVGTYAVVTHIDYAARYWPTERAGPFDPKRFEDEFRQAMRAIAGTGRALKLNVGRSIRPWVPQSWREEGGQAITMASDAHTPTGSAGTSTKRWPWLSTSASTPAAVPPTSGLADHANESVRVSPSREGMRVSLRRLWRKAAPCYGQSSVHRVRPDLGHDSAGHIWSTRFGQRPRPCMAWRCGARQFRDRLVSPQTPHVVR
jgi:histidinol-phosphatase (PHP family)